jgi:hypothetical protein
MRPSRPWLALGGFLALASCRSILDIHPGTLDADAESQAGNSGGGMGATSGGTTPQMGEGGDGSPTGGKGGSSNAGGKAGTNQGGSTPEGGSLAEAGSGVGGGDEGPVSLFPAGFCDDCIARNCPAAHQLCQDDGACAAGIPQWLDCAEEDADACVVQDAGTLRDLELCAAESCDVCRDLVHDQPSVEIVTPANGAPITLDQTGLVEVSVRVHAFQVQGLGTCGTEMDCGHIHLNIDEGANCRIHPFYNNWVTVVDATGSADSTVDTTQCVVPITGKTVKLTASLSAAVAHQDRLPLVQSTVNIVIQD